MQNLKDIISCSHEHVHKPDFSVAKTLSIINSMQESEISTKEKQKLPKNR